MTKQTVPNGGSGDQSAVQPSTAIPTVLRKTARLSLPAQRFGACGIGWRRRKAGEHVRCIDLSQQCLRVGRQEEPLLLSPVHGSRHHADVAGMGTVPLFE